MTATALDPRLTALVAAFRRRRDLAKLVLPTTALGAALRAALAGGRR